MHTALLDLISNFAILFLPVFAWVQLHLRPRIAERPSQAVLFGIMLGLGAILSMLTPFEIQPGVFIDTRGAAMVTAGFFGGPIAGAIAVVMAASLRIWLGGAGTTAGTAAILIAGVVGILACDLLGGRPRQRTHVLVLAAVVATAVTVSIFLLPRPIWPLALSTVALPSAIVTMIGTLVLGFLLVEEERRGELMRTNLIYRTVAESLPDSLNVKDLDGHFVVANAATAELMRAPGVEALIGRTDFDFYPPDTAARFRAEEVEALSVGTPAPIEQNIVHADGTSVWLSTLKVPVRDQTGRIVYLITHNRDVTVRRNLEERLSQSRALLSAALAHMADGIVMFDADRRLAFCNEQYRRFFSLTADVRVPGARLRDILEVSAARGEQVGASPEHLERWIEELERSLDTGSDRIVHLSNGRWLNARTRPLKQGGCLIVFTDTTAQKVAQDALAATNRKLAHLAATDELTGLANRRTFDLELRNRMRRVGGVVPLSLLMIDVDHFKAFNDTYGHQAGDECLQAVAACLREALGRDEDLAARYGGEEFAVILPGTDEPGARAVAERLREAVEQRAVPHLGNAAGFVTLSVGVASMSDADPLPTTPERLIGDADRALYLAKRTGRNQVRSSSEVARDTPADPAVRRGA